MINEKHMKRCLELAVLGEGRVSPNPLVGSVVLDKDGNVVGEGFHEKYGEAHAEINALNEAGNKAEGGTIYVSLEPCSHYGKTPPCIDRIIKEKIKTLVVGMIDPNPFVKGEGIKKAKEAGITVIGNVLNGKCKKINEIFIKNITLKKPFVAVKTASTIDGKVATSTGSSKWITSELARAEVQRLRNKYDAIITGSQTVIKDNPSLTSRMKNGKNPVRVIVDSELKTSPVSKVYEDNATVIIAVSEGVSQEKISLYPANVEIIKCTLGLNNKIDLNCLVEKLFEKGLKSLLVESGGTLNGAFLKANLIDKFYFFLAPKILADSTALGSFVGFDVQDINESFDFEFGEIKSFSPDLMIEGYKKQ